MADKANGDAAAQAVGAAKERREIPGRFPYTPAPGVLGRALARIVVSERPSQFSYDFLSTVLGVSGGSARAVIPILKRAGLLNSDGTPTERYAQFQSERKRANAALEALRAGWPELFRKNRYAERLEKSEVEDLFGEITGLKKTDPIFRAITSTYDVFREYAKDASSDNVSQDDDVEPVRSNSESAPSSSRPDIASLRLGLSNQINIILPETTDINVYHAIFRALRESLLK